MADDENWKNKNKFASKSLFICKKIQDFDSIRHRRHLSRHVILEILRHGRFLITFVRKFYWTLKTNNNEKKFMNFLLKHRRAAFLLDLIRLSQGDVFGKYLIGFDRPCPGSNLISLSRKKSESALAFVSLPPMRIMFCFNLFVSRWFSWFGSIKSKTSSLVVRRRGVKLLPLI